MVQRSEPDLPFGFFFTDETRVPDASVVLDDLPPSVGVIVRDYGRPDRIAYVHELVSQCRRHGRCVLVAGDADLALSAGADGVHWPSWRLRSCVKSRPRSRPKSRPKSSRGSRRGNPIGWLETAAVHRRSDMILANRRQVDGVFVSPVFPTASHPAASGLGVNRFARLAAEARMPVYALGGVRATDGGRLAMAGASGIAGIDVFIRG